MRYIFIVMNEIGVFIWFVLFEDLGSVNLKHERNIYVRNAIYYDVAIVGFNWYVMLMIIMMILIWDDIVNKDHVNMNCYYWWIYLSKQTKRKRKTKT